MDRRIVRRGVAFRPTAAQVAEARAAVRQGLPVHPRWLPFLPPRLRLRARLSVPVSASMEIA